MFNKLRIAVTALLLVALLAVSVSVAMAPAAEAADYSCAYLGHAFLSEDDSNPVPDGTDIRAIQDSTVLEQTTTGLWPGYDDNEFYFDVDAVPGSTMHFQIWDAGIPGWVDATETAVHVMYGRVEIDLHTGTPSIHIDADPWLGVYPGPDCDLPDALTNIEGQDCTAITIWGVEGGSWMSFDVATYAGALGTYGMDAGQAYVITHDDCVCTDWEMCTP